MDMPRQRKVWGPPLKHEACIQQPTGQDEQENHTALLQAAEKPAEETKEEPRQAKDSAQNGVQDQGRRRGGGSKHKFSLQASQDRGRDCSNYKANSQARHLSAGRQGEGYISESRHNKVCLKSSDRKGKVSQGRRGRSSWSGSIDSRVSSSSRSSCGDAGDCKSKQRSSSSRSSSSSSKEEGEAEEDLGDTVGGFEEEKRDARCRSRDRFQEKEHRMGRDRRGGGGRSRQCLGASRENRSSRDESKGKTRPRGTSRENRRSREDSRERRQPTRDRNGGDGRSRNGSREGRRPARIDTSRNGRRSRDITEGRKQPDGEKQSRGNNRRAERRREDSREGRKLKEDKSEEDSRERRRDKGKQVGGQSKGKEKDKVGDDGLSAREKWEINTGRKQALSIAAAAAIDTTATAPAGQQAQKAVPPASDKTAANTKEADNEGVTMRLGGEAGAKGAKKEVIEGDDESDMELDDHGSQDLQSHAPGTEPANSPPPPPGDYDTMNRGENRGQHPPAPAETSVNALKSLLVGATPGPGAEPGSKVMPFRIAQQKTRNLAPTHLSPSPAPLDHGPSAHPAQHQPSPELPPGPTQHAAAPPAPHTEPQPLSSTAPLATLKPQLSAQTQLLPLDAYPQPPLLLDAYSQPPLPFIPPPMPPFQPYPHAALPHPTHHLHLMAHTFHDPCMYPAPLLPPLHPLPHVIPKPAPPPYPPPPWLDTHAPQPPLNPAGTQKASESDRGNLHSPERSMKPKWPSFSGRQAPFEGSLLSRRQVHASEHREMAEEARDLEALWCGRRLPPLDQLSGMLQQGAPFQLVNGRLIPKTTVPRAAAASPAGGSGFNAHAVQGLGADDKKTATAGMGDAARVQEQGQAKGAAGTGGTSKADATAVREAAPSAGPEPDKAGDTATSADQTQGQSMNNTRQPGGRPFRLGRPKGKVGREEVGSPPPLPQQQAQAHSAPLSIPEASGPTGAGTPTGYATTFSGARAASAAPLGAPGMEQQQQQGDRSADQQQEESMPGDRPAGRIQQLQQEGAAGLKRSTNQKQDAEGGMREELETERETCRSGNRGSSGCTWGSGKGKEEKNWEEEASRDGSQGREGKQEGVPKERQQRKGRDSSSMKGSKGVKDNSSDPIDGSSRGVSRDRERLQPSRKVKADKEQRDLSRERVAGKRRAEDGGEAQQQQKSKQKREELRGDSRKLRGGTPSWAQTPSASDVPDRVATPRLEVEDDGLMNTNTEQEREQEQQGRHGAVQHHKRVGDNEPMDAGVWTDGSSMQDGAGSWEGPGLGGYVEEDLAYITMGMVELSTLLLSGDMANQLGADKSSKVAEEEGMMQQVMKKMGRPYKQNTLARLMEDGRMLKKAGERIMAAARDWTPLAMVRYLESVLKYLEAAYGHEQCLKHERGTSKAIALLEMLTKNGGMLMMVHSQCKARQRLHRLQHSTEYHHQQGGQQQQQQQGGSSDGQRPLDGMPLMPSAMTPDSPQVPLLSGAGRGAAGNSGGGGGPQDSDGVLLMLEAIRLLALKLSAISNSKLLLLQEEQLLQVVSALEAPAADLPLILTPPSQQPSQPQQSQHGTGAVPEAGGRHYARDGSWGGGSPATVGMQGGSSANGVPGQEGQAGSSNTDVPLRHTQPVTSQQQQQQQPHNGVHNADCASSTRDAVAAAASVPSLADHLQVLASCMRQDAAAAQQWKQAADGSRAFYKVACAAAASTATTPQLPSASDVAAAAAASSTGLHAGSLDGCVQHSSAGAHDMCAAHPEVNGSEAVGARLAHIAATQLLAMGYESGVWDLLGTVTMAEQVLSTVAQMPGMC